MKRFVVLLSLTALIAFIGCGVSDSKLADAEKRIESLLERGVPDSLLSRAKVFIYQAREAKKRGDGSLARMSADSMEVLLQQAEDNYAKDLERLRPYIDSLKGVFNDTRQELSGLQEKRLDSLEAVVDSFAQMNWLLQAEAKAKEIVAYLPELKQAEEKAAELRNKVLGTWVCTNVTKKKTDPTVNAVEKKIFTFNRDGSGKFIEKKIGKSGQFLKEDWEFRSWGSFDLFADTVHLLVDRFAAVKQDFTELKKVDGKPKWVTTSHPTYDSTITDGSQNRYINYDDLLADFKRQ
ncbi:MAG: hypothetical protein ACOC4C_02025 [Fibrobacterota bacterium]